jgi:regulatory protein
MNKVTPQVALTRLQKICSLQEKCIADIMQKLGKWEISGEESKTIIESLIGDKFIDEERFAVFFVRDKNKIYKWGREKIKYALIHKGIPAEVIEAALTEINEDKYNDALKELLIKKRREIKSKNLYEMKGKLIRFGTQRGYSYEIVYKLVDEVLKD